MENKGLYTTPEKYRKMENLHILFWLVKDTCWCLNFRWPGIVMVFPTLLVAVLICWRTRRTISEFTHNLAIIFWITANSLWMISEFFEWGDDFRYWSLIPFGCGLLILIFYYGYYLPFKEKRSLAENQPLSGSSTANKV